MKACVVMYHYIEDPKTIAYPKLKYLDSASFSRQIKYLKSNYTVVSVEQLIDYLESGEKLPDKPALLTFDDGYKDHYTQAFPILQEHGVSGAFYVPTEVLNKRLLDVNKIHLVLASTDKADDLAGEVLDLYQNLRSAQDMEAHQLFDKYSSRPLRFDTKQVIFVKQFLQTGEPDAIRAQVLDKLFAKYVGRDEQKVAEEYYLNWQELKSMKDGGMHIGGHGQYHTWAAQRSEVQQQAEIQSSKEFLTRLGYQKPYFSYCYPYGSYNLATIEMLKAAGFSMAFAAKAGEADIGQANRFEIQRWDTRDLPG